MAARARVFASENRHGKREAEEVDKVEVAPGVVGRVSQGPSEWRRRLDRKGSLIEDPESMVLYVICLRVQTRGSCDSGGIIGWLTAGDKLNPL